MDASNGAAVAGATSADDILRQQQLRGDAGDRSDMDAPAGGFPFVGMMSYLGRGQPPKIAAATSSPVSHGQFRLMLVALPRAAEWNRRIADWLAD